MSTPKANPRSATRSKMSSVLVRKSNVDTNIDAEYADYKRKLEQLSKTVSRLHTHITSVDQHWSKLVVSQRDFADELVTGYPGTSDSLKSAFASAQDSTHAVWRDIWTPKPDFHPTKAEAKRLLDYSQEIDATLKAVCPAVERAFADASRLEAKADKLLARKGAAAGASGSAPGPVANAVARQEESRVEYRRLVDSALLRMKEVYDKQEPAFENARGSYWELQAGASAVVHVNASTIAGTEPAATALGYSPVVKEEENIAKMSENKDVGAATSAGAVVEVTPASVLEADEQVIDNPIGAEEEAGDSSEVKGSVVETVETTVDSTTAAGAGVAAAAGGSVAAVGATLMRQSDDKDKNEDAGAGSTDPAPVSDKKQEKKARKEAEKQAKEEEKKAKEAEKKAKEAEKKAKAEAERKAKAEAKASAEAAKLKAKEEAEAAKAKAKADAEAAKAQAKADTEAAKVKAVAEATPDMTAADEEVVKAEVAEPAATDAEKVATNDEAATGAADESKATEKDADTALVAPVEHATKEGATGGVPEAAIGSSSETPNMGGEGGQSLASRSPVDEGSEDPQNVEKVDESLVVDSAPPTNADEDANNAAEKTSKVVPAVADTDEEVISALARARKRTDEGHLKEARKSGLFGWSSRSKKKGVAAEEVPTVAGAETDTVEPGDGETATQDIGAEGESASEPKVRGIFRRVTKKADETKEAVVAAATSAGDAVTSVVTKDSEGEKEGVAAKASSRGSSLLRRRTKKDGASADGEDAVAAAAEGDSEAPTATVDPIQTEEDVAADLEVAQPPSEAVDAAGSTRDDGVAEEAATSPVGRGLGGFFRKKKDTATTAVDGETPAVAEEASGVTAASEDKAEEAVKTPKEGETATAAASPDADEKVQSKVTESVQVAASDAPKEDPKDEEGKPSDSNGPRVMGDLGGFFRRSKSKKGSLGSPASSPDAVAQATAAAVEKKAWDGVGTSVDSGRTAGTPEQKPSKSSRVIGELGGIFRRASRKDATKATSKNHVEAAGAVESGMKSESIAVEKSEDVVEQIIEVPLENAEDAVDITVGGAGGIPEGQAHVDDSGVDAGEVLPSAQTASLERSEVSPGCEEPSKLEVTANEEDVVKEEAGHVEAMESTGVESKGDDVDKEGDVEKEASAFVDDPVESGVLDAAGAKTETEGATGEALKEDASTTLDEAKGQGQSTADDNVEGNAGDDEEEDSEEPKAFGAPFAGSIFRRRKDASKSSRESPAQTSTVDEGKAREGDVKPVVEVAAPNSVDDTESPVSGSAAVVGDEAEKDGVGSMVQEAVDTIEEKAGELKGKTIGAGKKLGSFFRRSTRKESAKEAAPPEKSVAKADEVVEDVKEGADEVGATDKESAPTAGKDVLESGDSPKEGGNDIGGLSEGPTGGQPAAEDEVAEGKSGLPEKAVEGAAETVQEISSSGEGGTGNATSAEDSGTTNRKSSVFHDLRLLVRRNTKKSAAKAAEVTEGDESEVTGKGQTDAVAQTTKLAASNVVDAGDVVDDTMREVVGVTEVVEIEEVAQEAEVVEDVKKPNEAKLEIGSLFRRISRKSTSSSEAVSGAKVEGVAEAAPRRKLFRKSVSRFAKE